MVIIFDNSEKYFSDVKPINSGLTNTSSVSDVKPMNNDSNVDGGVIIIPVSLDSVPNDLKNTQNTHTRDLFEQVKKNMSDKAYSQNHYAHTKIGDGFMRIDRI